MKRILILNARLINEGQITDTDLLIKDGFISKIGKDLSGSKADHLIDAKGCYLLPGLIDDQVHFREPGLTHKGNIRSEARAAVAGGITSFMEMPNTQPQTVTQQLLAEKFALAAKQSLANFSFYMGATNNNLEDVLKTSAEQVCGIKIFMGSSTGDMLVDEPEVLTQFFSKVNMLIAVHCEHTPTINANEQRFKAKYGENIPPAHHPDIRSAEACYRSSAFAVNLAKQHQTRLHVLHVSTAAETELFSADLPLSQKKITAEACVHHLWFSAKDYAEKGTLIKWNPAIKTEADQAALYKALAENKIDLLATDHAPHTLAEKQNSYFKAPSGGPLVQHHLQALFDLERRGKISLEKIVEKACHNPAILFGIEKRGFVREGYWADLVLFDPAASHLVHKKNLHYHCGWSPFEGHTFSGSVTHTIVSGHLAYAQGKFDESVPGKRLRFMLR